jgi:hypothetical protein
MIGHVKRDHAELSRHGFVIEQMAVLAAVGTRGVETKKRNAAAGILEVHSVRDVAHGDVEIAADDRLHVRHGRQASSAPTARMRFMARWRALAFCMAASVSPSRTNPGTRISIAKKS